MPVKIIVAGVMGRVGREIARAVLADSEAILVGCTERVSHGSIGRPLSAFVENAGSDVTICDSLEGLSLQDSVLIDFTTPDSTCSSLDIIAGRHGKIVVGTTGLSEDQIAHVKKAARQCAVVFSPNMSLGINVLFSLTQRVAEQIGNSYDIEIIEAHHRTKKDSPSGTARRLAEIASEAIGKGYEEAACHGRHGLVGERPAGEIGVHAVRGGDIVGDHTVLFAGPGERIELRHMAHSRTTFAHGAVAAAKWLAQKERGLYSMRDVLEL